MKRSRWSIAVLLLLSTHAAAQGGPSPARALPPAVLTIGTEGQPDYEFLRIRTAVRTAAGELAVADASQEIRVFGPTGGLLRKLGRNGEGPGEFRQVSALFASGDTLIAYDASLRRFTWYASKGTLLKTTRLEYPAEEGRLSIVGRLARGQWVVTTGHSPGWDHGPETYRDTSRVGTVRETGGSVRWVGEFPGMVIFVHIPAGRKAEWRAGMVPHSPLPIFTAWRDSILVGDMGSAELTYYSASGQRGRTLQLPRPTITGTMEKARSAALAEARTAEDRAGVMASYEAASKSRYRRLWDQLVVADNGNLWLGVANLDVTTERTYLVVGPNGSRKGAWILPPSGRILHVRGAELIVSERNADDVEFIRVYRLVRP